MNPRQKQVDDSINAVCELRKEVEALCNLVNNAMTKASDIADELDHLEGMVADIEVGDDE